MGATHTTHITSRGAGRALVLGASTMSPTAIPGTALKPVDSTVVPATIEAVTAVPEAVETTPEPAIKKSERVEILAVLTRAAQDPSYIAQLTYSPGEALTGYNLSMDARGALAAGDVRWIEERVGKLNARLRTWLDCRLQQEIW